MNFILIAGLPATGKSRFAEYCRKQLSIPLVCKDSIKEILFDTVGFRSHDEKTMLNHASLEILLYLAETMLQADLSVILENNFENYAKPRLNRLIEQYNCHVVTVFFSGDAEILYRRYVERNADSTRHRGHVLSTQYPEREHIGHIPPPIPLEEYRDLFEQRGMATPPVGGTVIYVDASDFSNVVYEDILSELKSKLR